MALWWACLWESLWISREVGERASVTFEGVSHSFVLHANLDICVEGILVEIDRCFNGGR
jgi:hypothetical protein